MATSGNPVYMGFVNYLKREFDKAGLVYVRDESTPTQVLENRNFVDFQFRTDQGTHKVYVPKNVGTMGSIHTTLFFDPKRVAGVRELPKTGKKPTYKNGLIRSHLEPDAARVARLVIEALKGGAPVPTKRAPIRDEDQRALRDMNIISAGVETGRPAEGDPDRETMTVTAGNVEDFDAEEFVQMGRV